MRKLESSLEGLARQLMMQQLFVEERIRSDGDSGQEIQKYKKKNYQLLSSTYHILVEHVYHENKRIRLPFVF
jgi:hypothetical protein